MNLERFVAKCAPEEDQNLELLEPVLPDPERWESWPLLSKCHALHVGYFIELNTLTSSAWQTSSLRK